MLREPSVISSCSGDVSSDCCLSVVWLLYVSAASLTLGSVCTLMRVPATITNNHSFLYLSVDFFLVFFNPPFLLAFFFSSVFVVLFFLPHPKKRNKIYYTIQSTENDLIANFRNPLDTRCGHLAPADPGHPARVLCPTPPSFRNQSSFTGPSPSHGDGGVTVF